MTNTQIAWPIHWDCLTSRWHLRSQVKQGQILTSGVQRSNLDHNRISMMQSECAFTWTYPTSYGRSKILLSHVSIASLNAHYVDLQHDPSIANIDVLCLTEMHFPCHIPDDTYNLQSRNLVSSRTAHGTGMYIRDTYYTHQIVPVNSQQLECTTNPKHRLDIISGLDVIWLVEEHSIWDFSEIAQSLKCPCRLGSDKVCSPALDPLWTSTWPLLWGLHKVVNLWHVQ